MRDTVWHCADGRRLLVSEMSDSHLHNTIAKVRREGWRIKYLPRLEIELTIRAIKNEGRK